jgi:hypothetical protein
MYDGNKNKFKRGFIALTSAILISSVLLTLAAAVSTSAFSSRFSALNGEYKRISLSLAESCVNSALLKIAQNYSYTTTNESVAVGSDNCTIVSIAYVPAGSGKRAFTIKTQGQYKGAFSNIAVAATAQDPSVAPVAPPPTCTLSATSNSILAGQHVTLAWNVAGSASTFNIIRSMNGIDSIIYSTASPANSSLSDAPSQSATYTATITGPGGSNQCVSPQQVEVSASVACAETVVILAGGMSSGDRANEGVAAKALLDLYAVVAPTPHVGVGSFGGLNGSAAQVPPGGLLTGTYGTKSPATGLYSTIDSIVTTVNSSGGSNLSAGIQAAQSELDGPRHQAGFKKVLIFVSDGKPNDPGSASQAEPAAVAAADTAKADTVQVFGVQYGSVSGRDLIAKISSGSYAYAAHQNGSYNDAGLSNNSGDIAAENADGDYFFIAPDSSAMATIFDEIGKKVCPAAVPPPPPNPPPTPAIPTLPPNLTLGSWQETPTSP